jgi:4-hydroxybenzoate polyprenyltransferase
MAVFLIAAKMLNPLCFMLAPVALGVRMFYSYTKRFTALAHIVLGFCLGIAPAGAWIAMRGTLDPRILWLTAAVTLWTGGFDINYACQDYAFDVHAGLYSIPQKLGIPGALWVSRTFHAGMLACLVMLVLAFNLGAIAWIGIAAVAGLLAWEHRLVRAGDLTKIDAAFFTMNGYVSVLFFVFWATDILLQ